MKRIVFNWKSNPLFYIVTCFVILRFYILFLQFPASIGGDSISYRSTQGELPEFLSYLRYWPETLKGDSARSILPVTFFYFIPTDNLRVIGQSILSILSWTFMSLQVSRYVYDSKRIIQVDKANKLIFSIFLFIGLSPQVTEWNKLIYSESLILSSTCILIGISLKKLTSSRFNFYIRLVIILTLLFLLITARINILPIALFFTGFYIFRDLNFKFNVKTLSNWFPLFLLVLTIVISLLYLDRQNENWKQFISREVTTFSYYLSEDNPAASSFISYLSEQKISKCLEIPTAPLASGSQMFWGSKLYTKNFPCKDSVLWLERNSIKLIIGWITNEPESAFQTYRRALIASSRNVSLFAYMSPVPEFLNNIVFPKVDPTISLPDLYNMKPGREPRAGYDPIVFFAILLPLLLLSDRAKLKTDNFQSLVLYLLIILIFAASVGMGIFAIPGPPAEVYRLSFFSWLLLRIYVIWHLSLLFQYKVNQINLIRVKS